MKKIQGCPLPLGVTIQGDIVNFSVAVPSKKDCKLLLYRVGEETPSHTYSMSEEKLVGEVRYLALKEFEWKKYEYNYKIDDEVIVDPYVRCLQGRKRFGDEVSIQNHEIRGKIDTIEFDWEDDAPLQIPYQDIVAYSLHVRGFTQHISSKVKHRGTYSGIIEKISYLQDLGINQIQCMPIYEFEERRSYTNYWGYGPAYCFAPKSSYAASEDSVTELKTMVKACHQAQIEVVLELPFTQETAPQKIEECLRYYRINFHIDGFILNPEYVPMRGVKEDPILSTTKIMKNQDGFQITMRRFLKGDEGMVEDVMWWLKHHSKEEGIYNCIANHNGFTLADAVSYDGKHNELNGEHNQDGPNYNYSWNCGVEGATRKKSVVELRKKQMKNAFFILLMAQGTPCILAGDEFAHTQKGNNNVYCQDNEISWIDWKQLEKNKELYVYVKTLIQLRQSHPILHPMEELLGVDQMSCGVPDVSYHGASAWQVPSEVASRQLGVYYAGACAMDDDCFIAYNMHWEKHPFALPALSKGKRWYKVVATDAEVAMGGEVIQDQKEVIVAERTIVMFIGRLV
ncbi:MAG: alpha-amylase family glycosyl hydrolase [Lachnospiraceae bacterium]